MRKHALLSASGASRWLTCTPSPRLEETMSEQESDYADEGTLAHEVGEWMIKEKAYGIDISRKLEELEKSPLGEKFFSEEMLGFCDEYAQFVVDKVREAPHGARLLQEHRLSLSKYIPEGFGTVDNAIVADHTLEIIDLKYGKGVPVDAYENKQMMVYALGALESFDLLYNIHTVIMTIFQPRIGNISSYEITADNLRRWANEELRPKAIMAFQGVGDFIPGDHCRFCRVRATCEAHAKHNLQLAAREFDITTITDEQLVKIFNRSKQIKNWLTSIETHMLREALGGKKYPGLKLVQGRSVRKLENQDDVLDKLVENGYEGDKLVNKKMLGIIKLSKLVSKLHMKEIIEPNLSKPPGKPTLVVLDDKRPEWDASEAAQADFDDFQEAED